MEQQDHHGLNLNLSIKCSDHHLRNVIPSPQAPPPAPAVAVAPISNLLTLVPTRPFQFTPSPYNSLSLEHFRTGRRSLNDKPPSYGEMDKEMDEYVESKRRQAALAMVANKHEKLVVSSHSKVSTTSLSGTKRVEREGNHKTVSKDEDGGDAVAATAAARKKLMLSKDQAAVLEETFKEYHTLSTKHKVTLAKQLRLQPREVEVWFQNRRAKTKLKQRVVDRGYLKRYCKNLSNENKRLKKELAELRAHKLYPLTHMNMYTPTSLTMCPQCERVSASSSSSSSSTQVSIAAPTANNNHQNSTNVYPPKTISIIPFHKLISSKALNRPPQPYQCSCI